MSYKVLRVWSAFLLRAQLFCGLISNPLPSLHSRHCGPHGVPLTPQAHSFIRIMVLAIPSDKRLLPKHLCAFLPDFLLGVFAQRLQLIEPPWPPPPAPSPMHRLPFHLPTLSFCIAWDISYILLSFIVYIQPLWNWGYFSVLSTVACLATQTGSGKK